MSMFEIIMLVCFGQPGHFPSTSHIPQGAMAERVYSFYLKLDFNRFFKIFTEKKQWGNSLKI